MKKLNKLTLKEINGGAGTPSKKAPSKAAKKSPNDLKEKKVK